MPSEARVDAAPDAQERLALCDLFSELGPSVPTLIEGWTAHDLAAHLVLRERDPVAGPCLVLPGPFARFAERRRARLARDRDFTWLVARIRSGPPPGFFRIGWIRALANLNEFFVHHEDVRRANGRGPGISRRPWMPPCGEMCAAVDVFLAGGFAAAGSRSSGQEPTSG